MADAGVDLIADLHPARRHVVVLEDVHRVVHVVIHGAEHLAVGHTGPGSGRILHANGVPGVAEVEIDHDRQPGILAAHGHSRRLIYAAMAINRIARWIDKGAQADSVDAIAFENGQDIFLDTAGVFPVVAVGLHLWHPAYICAVEKGGGSSRWERLEQSAQCQCASSHTGHFKESSSTDHMP